MFERHFLAAVMGATAVFGCAPEPVTQRALAYAREHREKDGIALLRTQLSVDPTDLASRRLLIRLLASDGDLVGARDEIERLSQRLPEGDPSPWIELGHAYELSHRFEDALEAYDIATERAPSSPLGPREGGLRAARWGEAEWSRPRLEEAVRRGGGDVDVYHTLGLVNLNLGNLGAAAKAYRAGIAVDTQRPENWMGLATLAVMQNDPRAALQAYDAILTRNPTYGDAELGRAWALARLGRPRDAHRALDRAEQLGAPAVNIAKQREALNDSAK